MKRRQKSSASASALQITLSAALLSILTILFASSFRAAAPASPNAPSARVTEGEKGSANAGQAFRPGVFATDALLTFSNTGSLNTARSVHTETLLANGKVLVTGGNNGIDGFLASAELYDPANGSWGATGSLSTARHAHTATLLPNGKVLVVAGLGNSGFLGSAQLYDPASGNWSSTGGLAIGRYNHTATLLPNGKVLVAGGAANSGDLGSAQLYDVTSGTWSATGSFSIPRHAHTATSLPNGKVLIAGGEDVNGRFSSAQLYDPTSGTWSTTGSLTTARSYHTATLLANGKVLVAGGIDVATGELYDPVTGSWSSTGSLNGNRGQHKATLLPNGTVLVTGGLGVSFLNSTELYDPASGNWSAAGNLNAARLQHTATLLPDGRVLVAGGFDDGPDNGGSLVSAELYGSVNPTPTPTGTPTVTPIPVSPTPTPTPTAGPATPTPALSPSPAPDTIYFFYQNFDSMAPPGLPSNWQTSFVNGAADCTPAGTCAFGTNWVTTKSNPYTGPICVFHDAPACVTDSNLDTQSFFVPNVSNLQNVSITFQHNFDLENGRDGGVLEISYDGGCFSDIVGAGGTANYNGTISTGFLSPIAERNAWTGNSGGYVSGIATLPSAAKGHSVRLRFRLATDCSGSGTGWRIDVLDVHARLVPPGTPAPSPSPSPFQTPLPGICSFSEAFDNVPALPNTGWAKKNNSSPLGLTDWGFGDPARFPAQAGATSSYLAVNSYTGCAGATISNWEMTPPVRLQNGGAFTFWTRTAHAPTRPDRLQVRMSTNDNSSNVGTTATSVGDFTTLLLDINPTYTTSGYPSVWTQYTIVLNGLGSPVTGRLAFRYFVENGGPNGPNSDYIGIDTVSYNCNPPTPTPSPTPTASPSPMPTPVPPTPTPAVTPSPAPDTVYFLNENFDRTIPPALPSGWSTSFVNGAADCTPTGTCAFGTNWVTTKNNPYAGPISVFHDAPACVTDSYLNTRSFFVPNSSNIPTIPVSFVHSFNLESGRDGGVLEISYDGGCFVDIVAAGGSANYNGTISTAFQSPIAGRNAWTGNSGGYVNASGTLPSSVKGHSVTLRFRLATDCSGSGSGWSIDAINIQVHVSGSGTPVPSPTPSPSPITTPTVPPSVCSFSEAFNNVGTLPASGWALKNNSSPLGITNWSTGDAARFSAQSGAASSYIAAGSAVGCATLSTWLLTPHITLQNGGAFTFWTRTVNSPIHPDRLQVLMSTNGNSSNVGTTATSVGDFTTLLLDINPTYTTSGYPNAWTQYTVTLSGLGSPVTGRLAFRYFVENGGPYGTNSDYIGIDTVSYNCNPPTPTPSPSPTPTPTPTPSPTPTPTATPISISGTISYCSAPVPGPVPNVTLALTGTMSGSTLSDGSGNYQLSAASGGSYTVTPTKSARTPASDGITTVDVIATQRHFLTLGTPLSGCRLTAADVNGDASVTTIDVIAIQRFYLGLSTGTANVGVYRFNPANRTYPGVISNQSGENYDTLIFGDVASPFVE